MRQTRKRKDGNLRNSRHLSLISLSHAMPIELQTPKQIQRSPLTRSSISPCSDPRNRDAHLFRTTTTNNLVQAGATIDYREYRHIGEVVCVTRGSLYSSGE